MKLKKNFVAATMLAGATTIMSFMSAGTAQAQGALVMYCGVQEEWCRAMTTAFERETGIKVAMTRKSSGEIYAQVKAEAANPRADIWWGGTGDPHMQAAEEGLTRRIQVSRKRANCTIGRCASGSSPRARTVGIYSGALGFGYNTELLEVEGRRRSRNAGPTSSTPSSRMKSRSPTRTRRAPPIRCWRRSCS